MRKAITPSVLVGRGRAAFARPRISITRYGAAFTVENPGMLSSAAFVPSNIMGLHTSQNASTGVNLLPFLPNYSNGQSADLAPDLLAKVAFKPG